MPLSDREILCSFMEPKPSPNTHGSTFRSGKNWWHWDGCEWIPGDTTLDAIHKIEARLFDKYGFWFVSRYEHEMSIANSAGPKWTPIWHADAEQKTRALAAVLRPIVEAPNAA